jgi:thiosulfate/3-mercaptopyruvate sulfurtransferase
MKTLLFTLLLALPGLALEPLVSTEWVASNLGKKIILVDVSDAERYGKGHLPGAVSTAIGEWRMPKEKHLVVRPEAQIEAHMRALGVDNGSRVVLYAHIDTPKDFLKASYVYWAMKYHGLAHVAIMDGGYDKWLKEKRPTSTEVVHPSKGTFRASLQQERFADRKYVTSSIGTVPMLDARPTEYYFGLISSPGVERAGHIEKATSYPWNYSVNTDYTVKPKHELEPIFSNGLGLKKDRELIVYCTGGLETSFNYFILEGYLGYDDVRLYDASMKDWGNRSDTPMVRYKWEMFPAR